MPVNDPLDPIDPVIDPIPPRRPGYRRYWDTYNRPYPGCGCLWVIIVIAFIIWLIYWAGGYHWGGAGPGTGVR